jgi:hypothetical protein
MNQKDVAREARVKGRLVSFGFAAAGAILILASSLLAGSRYDTVRTVLLNLGVVVVAIVLLEFLWRFVGGDPLRREIDALREQVARLERSTSEVEQREKIGLVAVHDRLSNFGTEEYWMSLLTGASESVDMLGRTLFGWHDARELGDVLKAKISTDGVRYRWLIMSPTNPYLAQLDSEPGAMLSQKIERMCTLFRQIHAMLPADKADHLQLRGFRSTPLTCSIVRFDDLFVVNQYLSTRSSRKSPIYVAKGRKEAWPAAFRDEFDQLWEGSEDLLRQEAAL